MKRRVVLYWFCLVFILGNPPQLYSVSIAKAIFSIAETGVATGVQLAKFRRRIKPVQVIAGIFGYTPIATVAILKLEGAALEFYSAVSEEVYKYEMDGVNQKEDYTGCYYNYLNDEEEIKEISGNTNKISKEEREYMNYKYYPLASEPELIKIKRINTEQMVELDKKRTYMLIASGIIGAEGQQLSSDMGLASQFFVNKVDDQLFMLLDAINGYAKCVYFNTMGYGMVNFDRVTF